MPTVTTVDPATGHELATYDAHDEAAVAAALAGAHAAYVGWSARPLGERTDLLRAVGKLLTERREEYAALMTAEMGKPLAEALAEVDKCAWNCEVVADSAPEWLADHEVASGAARSWLSYEPLGVVFAVMPWNYPFWQVLRFASAALVAGNAGVLKHSPNVTGCALAIERVFADAGAPAGLFTTLVLADEQLAEMTPRIIGDPAVAAVTLTGSERAGEAVGSAAGRFLKKSVLELGGSDPFVVLDDADLEAAADVAVKSRFGNGGQSCIAAKRFIVAESVADEFVVAADRPHRCPRARTDGARRPARPAARPGAGLGLVEGAVLVAGGSLPGGPGWFYPPTVLDHVTPRMTAFDEETFGPVAAVVRARDDDHAVELANDTAYGLGAAVWSARRAGSRWAGGSAPARCSSTRWSPPTRGCRSVASAARATVASCRRRARASSPTYGRSTWGRDAVRPRRPQRRVPGRDAGLVRRALGLEVEFEFALEAFEFSGTMLRSPEGWRLELLHREGNVAGIVVERPMDAALTRGFGHLALPSTTWRRRTSACSPPARPRGCRRASLPSRGPHRARRRPRRKPGRAAGPAHDRSARGQDRAHHGCRRWHGGRRGPPLRGGGAKVAGCDLDRDGAARTEELVRGEGGEITVSGGVDLGDPDAARAWVDAAVATYGGIDVLYNNASTQRFGALDELSIEDWDFTMRNELDLVYYTVRAAWPHLKAYGGGSIINVGSIAALRGVEFMPQNAHSTAKGGVIALTLQLVVEGGPHGIRANVISPGMTSTPNTAPMLADPPERMRRIVLDRIPLGRVGQPEDVVNAAVFLASDESSWISGTNIVVDGGGSVLG